MCMRACNALVLKLDYLSTTVCQKLHFLLSDAILRILSRASCACPRTLRVSAHISREDTQDGVSVGGFKMAAMSPVQLYIGQCGERYFHCDVVHITTKWVSSLTLDCNGVYAIKAYSRPIDVAYVHTRERGSSPGFDDLIQFYYDLYYISP